MVNIEDAPRLRELCEKASREYDHDKLLELVRQINELLEKKKRTSESQPTQKKAVSLIPRSSSYPLALLMSFNPLYLDPPAKRVA